MQSLIFYLFASLLVGAASLMITVRNPVHAALFLVLAFFCSAAIWLLLQAEFLAIALVLVYVGAVMVLFLFVVMMLDIRITKLREGFARFLPVGLLVAGVMLAAIWFILNTQLALPEQPSATARLAAAGDNTRLLGKALFSSYLYPFELAGAVLLVAIIAAISLSHRAPRTPRTPRPEQQVNVEAASRVRLAPNKPHGETAAGDD